MSSEGEGLVLGRGLMPEEATVPGRENSPRGPSFANHRIWQAQVFHAAIGHGGLPAQIILEHHLEPGAVEHRDRETVVIDMHRQQCPAIRAWHQ